MVMEFTWFKTMMSIFTDSSIFGFGVNIESDPKKSKSGIQKKHDASKREAQADKDLEELKQKRSAKEKTNKKQKSMH